MTLDASELVVGADARVHVGPTTDNGGSMPTGLTALTDPWRDLGYVTEDGFTFTDAKTIQDIRAYQSFYPLRRLITERDATVSFTMEQWNAATVVLAFGGGSITGSNPYTFTPPSPETLDERAMVLDWEDGTVSYRLVLPKGIVTENVETQVVRTNIAVLPITFSVTPASGDDPWYIVTDHTAWTDLGTGS